MSDPWTRNPLYRKQPVYRNQPKTHGDARGPLGTNLYVTKKHPPPLYKPQPPHKKHVPKTTKPIHTAKNQAHRNKKPPTGSHLVPHTSHSDIKHPKTHIISKISNHLRHFLQSLGLNVADIVGALAFTGFTLPGKLWIGEELGWRDFVGISVLIFSNAMVMNYIPTGWKFFFVAQLLGFGLGFGVLKISQ